MELDCTHSILRPALVSLAFSAGEEAKLYIEFCSWKVVAHVAWVDPGVRSNLLGGHSRWHLALSRDCTSVGGVCGHVATRSLY